MTFLDSPIENLTVFNHCSLGGELAFLYKHERLSFYSFLQVLTRIISCIIPHLLTTKLLLDKKQLNYQGTFSIGIWVIGPKTVLLEK